MTETGYRPQQFPSSGGVPNGRGGSSQRLKIYLTNSLEESHPDTGTLFANWLSSEANEANFIKRDAPVMIVMGNPPYSGESNNKGKWIMDLMEDYKKEPGGKEKLKERNPKWINDDYVKFMRYGQHYIERNGSGILAFINPHGFLDNPTFRGMRWNLLKTYDKIYTIDLHGNAKKKETSPDGSADVNVFDIEQGVSINILVKTGKKKANELGKVFHYDLFGKREFKYDFLSDNSLKTIDYKELPNVAPNYFFAPKNFSEQKSYDNSFAINELFKINNVGIVTARDSFTIHNSIDKLKETIEEFLSLDDETARRRFDLGNDVRDWQVNFAKKDLINNYPNDEKFVKISYRPFDNKQTFYTGKTKGFHCYPRNEVMQHFLKGKNLGLIIGRQGQVVGSMPWNLSFITNSITDFNMYYRGGGMLFPLYLYPETNGQLTTEEITTPPDGHPSKGEYRVPNLNPEIVNKIAKGLGLSFVPEKTTPPVGHPSKGGEFAPIDILDYMYAVLHSPSYREKYKEFLKIDFPKIPYPKDLSTFEKLTNLGAQIREIHLLESATVEEYITEFNIDGDCVVDKPKFVNSPPLEGCPTGGVVTNSNEKEIFINNIKIKQYPILDLPYNEALKQRAKELRRAENLSEVLFWMQVTKNGFHKIDFDRQRIIGNYIVDFYVKKLGLVIEIDGSSHDNKQEYDAKRQQYLESLGLRVYRIEVIDIMKRMKIVLKDLENYIIEQYTEEPPRPLGTPPKEGNVPPRPSGTPQEGNLGKVFINETQHFENVPEVAWSFYIGGYQPAQKWLKDRKGRKLEFDDILHYQKIIVALTETDRLMKEIDTIAIE